MQFIYSLFGAFVFWVAMTITMMASAPDIATGLVYSVPHVYITICVLIASAVIYQSRTFAIKEIVYWGIVQVLYIIVGVVYFIYEFEVKEFSLKNIGADEASSAAALKQSQAANFMFLFVLMTPAISHGLVVLMRVIDRGFEEFDIKFKAFAGIFALFVLLMLLSCFILVNWKDGLVFLAALIFLIYVVGNFGIYFKTGGFIPLLLKRINRTLILLAILASSVVSIFVDDLSTYEGLGISASVTLFFLWFYAVFHFAKDFIELDQKPVFYSGSLFPVYKFNPKINNVEAHYSPLMSWAIGLILIFIWGFYTNYSIAPAWFGAVMTIGIELLVLMSVIYLRSLTLEAAKHAIGFITPEVAKSAWITTKKIYATN